MNKPKSAESVKVIALNKRARFEYEIIETFEAGIMLTGAEIKSLRQGGISLAESYIRAEGSEVYLIRAHIAPYAFSSDVEYDPIRKRKLLLHRREIDKLAGKGAGKGLTMVPLRVYLKNGYAKLELALARGKDQGDKRETIKDREARRETARALKSSR